MIENRKIDKEYIRFSIWSVVSFNGSRHEYEDNWVELFFPLIANTFDFKPFEYFLEEEELWK